MEGGVAVWRGNKAEENRGKRINYCSKSNFSIIIARVKPIN